MTISVVTPVGRIVSGHPMESNTVKDDKTGLDKVDRSGNLLRSTYTALAIVKGNEGCWKETTWGQEIVKEAELSWPRGEWKTPHFSWKIADGDSTVPNKNGALLSEREGHAGHWIIKGSTFLNVKCYHSGKYQAHEQINDRFAIKRGDYGRLILTVRSNESTQTQGMYVSPSMFELIQSGVEIVPVGEGLSAEIGFGGQSAVLPTNMMKAAYVAPAQPAQPAQPAPPAPPAPVIPATDMVPPYEAMYSINGQTFSESEWLAADWTVESLAPYKV